MNDHDPTPGRVAAEAPPAPPDPEPFWADGRTVMATVKRRWPDLSAAEIEGALRGAVDGNAVRHRRLPPPPPEPSYGNVTVLGEGPPWYAFIRFDEQDVLRWFARREARLSEGPHDGRDGRLAVTGAAVVAGPDRPSGDRKAKRGPKIKDFWPKVLGYAAGWLAEKGEAPERLRELEDVILERIDRLGGEAERSTVRPYAREMLEGYKAQLDDE